MTDSEFISSKKYPCVVIAGRPNVGKSTLFNRLLRQRRSITDPVPGVTRDPVSSIWDLDGHKITLTDTGGIDYSDADFASLITDKSFQTLEKGDVILLLLDGKELTGEDEFVIQKMRRFTDKIILVINKLDSPEKDDLLWNFKGMGFSRIVGISSSQGRNIDVLTDEIKKLLADRFTACDDGDNGADDDADGQNEDLVNARISHIKLSIIGKPNTGKSTLLNRLTGDDRSIVSDIPGTTRDVIEGTFSYRDIKYTVYDTAGIRRKKKVTDDIEYYSVNRAIGSIDHAEVVLLMIDSLEGLTDQDKKIAYQIVKKGRGVVIVLNKWDMMPHTPNAERAMRDRLSFLFPILDFAPVVTISAREGQGIDKLMDTIFKVRRQLFTRISTSELNKAVREWVDDYPVPSAKGIRYKIRYATQAEVFPSRFLLFVNRPERFPDAYVSYIKNKIRKRFRLTMIPFEVEIRESVSRPREE
ncbi:MAG: ribosome biogenesis GTPase Der [Spirochaetia bacterium]|nr:ribosome biogenesis GTPase Der [Spirochaetia bacterium]